MRPISLPLRSMPNGVPVSHWTSPDWEDNGWDKAMRECAKRLNDAGIIVVLLEADEK